MSKIKIGSVLLLIGDLLELSEHPERYPNGKASWAFAVAANKLEELMKKDLSSCEEEE